jgi:hypothetical protein
MYLSSNTPRLQKYQCPVIINKMQSTSVGQKVVQINCEHHGDCQGLNSMPTLIWET